MVRAEPCQEGGASPPLSLLKLVAETGTDLTRWKTHKHFTSWLGLAPGKHESGRKRRRVPRPKTVAGQIFRECVPSIAKSERRAQVFFMGALHLVFWLVAVVFGMRLLGDAGRRVWGGGSSGLGVWMIICIVVSLQMMTALRPIIGRADTLLPTEKRFFVEHWVETLGGAQ